MPIFSKPVPFDEALNSSRIKKLLPTAASSAELSKLNAEIRERARFMARVNHAGFISHLDAGITSLLNPSDRSGPADAAELRLQLKQHLASIGYDPENPPEGFEPAKPGSIRDISSDSRLDLTIDTNTRMAYGYGQHLKSNDPDILDAFPCRELLREESRKEEREWRQRWIGAGGKLYGGGRMIARKDDPIWPAISAFGNPYPPFDWNSGMGVEEVDRAEAEALGVIKPSTVVQRDDRSFNQDVAVAMPKGISSGLATALQTVFKVAGEMLILEAIS